MLNPIKKTELSSAIDADTVGNLFLDLEEEIQKAANNLTVEVILRLIDKWEMDFEEASSKGKLTVRELLEHYVRLKISLHHLTRAWERGWGAGIFNLNAEQFAEKARHLHRRVKQSRRDYYVAKREYEAKCCPECDCRGCRCIKSFADYGP